jgi:alkanesulfonate monooxygenase SsuD/methylene tetrahydromethanopterin reductase-like flavin-dependent oxidoreductase (luciferase family)
MDIAVGLPNMVAGARGEELTECARRGEKAGFSSLGTLDRLVYPSLEPLTSLAAAAAVTERIRLTTAILIAPYRRNAALLAKEAATVHELSGGRLVLGVGLGWRTDDYETSGASFEDRGRELEAMLEEIERIWQGEERGHAGAIGPEVDPPPAILVGGRVNAAYRRAARFGAGWILGGGTPDELAEGKRKTEEAWKEAGREGQPRIAALVYYSLGEGAEEAAERDLKHYYAPLGEETASQIAASAATDPDTVRQYAQAFEQAGCDELIFFPCSSDPGQVDLLAEAALK